MRTLLRFASAALFGALCSFLPAADPPPPLVKPVVPANKTTRARIAVIEDKKTNMQFKAQIPKPQGKKGQMIDVKVMLETLPNVGQVTLKKWKAWGFEVPPNRVGVLPELIIPAAQIAPKPTKGRDIEIRITNVKLEIKELPGGGDLIGGCDMYLCLRDLTGGSDRVLQPRVYFADRFFELTASNAALKRLNTGATTSPDPMATPDDGLVPLVPAVGTMSGAQLPLFSFASVNGLTQYKTPTGKMEKINAGVSSTSNYAAPGITMTVNTALGCGVEMEKVPAEGAPVAGKVKELRLGLHTGLGFKVQKDLVLKDVVVTVVDDKSQSFIWLGPRFVEEFFKDGVYGCGSDGVWRLHGRVKADLLQDIKTRMPPKKP
ncbi:MAG: hypothetical protein L0241_08440 [Planctomycetia bacterium]|nr:hypothetical protein [Planctomycetia bacterium]